jgi:hypothetical protein
LGNDNFTGFIHIVAVVSPEDKVDFIGQFAVPGIIVRFVTTGVVFKFRFGAGDVVVGGEGNFETTPGVVGVYP